MRSTQIAIRLPDTVLAQLDERIPGQFPSRAAAVRRALESLLSEETPEQLVSRHRAGWLAHPLTPVEETTLLADARALIAEEPW